MNVTPAYLNLTLLPFAADEMKRVEQMFTNGQDKLLAVLKHVRNVYESTNGPLSFGIDFDELLNQMTKMIEAMVEFYHNTGVFTKQQLKAA